MSPITKTSASDAAVLRKLRVAGLAACIGLGAMGRPMAGHLQRAGHQLFVWARRPESVGDLAATRCATPAEVGRCCGVVFTVVTSSADVEGLALGPDGLIEGMAPGSVLIDCSTIDVESARFAHGHALEHNLPSIDAPVSGGTGGAKGATLTFMCGGTDAAFAAAKPVLENMGKKVVHCGKGGAGQAAKICNNMILGISMIGVSEAFALGEKLGLSHQALFDVAESLAAEADRTVAAAGDPTRVVVPAGRVRSRLQAAVPAGAALPPALAEPQRRVTLAAATSTHAAASGAGELHQPPVALASRDCLDVPVCRRGRLHDAPSLGPRKPAVQGPLI